MCPRAVQFLCKLPKEHAPFDGATKAAVCTTTDIGDVRKRADKYRLILVPERKRPHIVTSFLAELRKHRGELFITAHQGTCVHTERRKRSSCERRGVNH